MKYRKKPVIVEAYRYNGGEQNCGIPTEWIVQGNMDFGLDSSYLIIPTLEGNHRCDRGNWIIKGTAGEYYPVRADIFEATYEEVV